MTIWNKMEILRGRPYLALLLSLPVFFLFNTFVSDQCTSSLFRPLPKISNKLLPLRSRHYKNTSRRGPLIHVYNNFFKSKDWNSFWGHVKGSQSLRTLRHCPTKCRFTWNRSDLQSADFVLVSLAGYQLHGGKAVKLKYAKGEQIWVGFLHEAPTYRQRDYEAEDGVFNWVATHRRDSDVHVPSGKFFSINNNNNNSSQSGNTAAVEKVLRTSLKKKKLAGWLVSHCETPGEREILVKTLQRHIPVDIFGKCSDRKCPRGIGVDCRAYLGQRYKFYLAFENFLCLDYVTEKFYYSYQQNMVPVVFGGADYSLFGPPGSYINALDFNSVKDLADYLLFLDKNDDEYMKYFAWRGSLTCMLCKSMSDHMNNRKKGEQMSMTGRTFLSTGRMHRKEVPKTYKSVRKWHESLPVGQAKMTFRVGKHIIFNVSTSCVRPSEHAPFKKWMLGN